MMDVLQAAEKLDLPDWWIGAGFLRNKIWDYLEGKDHGPTMDVDLVYFDSSNIEPETDWDYDQKMNQQYGFAKWEVRNQARMHYVNDLEPFTSTADGISHWVETATCIAVRLKNGKLEYLYCYGKDDLLGLIARPTPYFLEQPMLSRFYERINEKQWLKKWPNLKVVEK